MLLAVALCFCSYLIIVCWPVCRPAKRVLIFNQQGQREALELLEHLFGTIKKEGLVHFDHVVFCTNEARESKGANKGMINPDFTVFLFLLSGMMVRRY